MTNHEQKDALDQPRVDAPEDAKANEAQQADAKKAAKKGTADFAHQAKEDAPINEYAKETHEDVSEDTLVPVYISSTNTEYTEEGGIKYLTGSVNGDTFRIALDQQTMVPKKYVGALQPLLDKQRRVKEAPKQPLGIMTFK